MKATIALAFLFVATGCGGAAATGEATTAPTSAPPPAATTAETPAGAGAAAAAAPGAAAAATGTPWEVAGSWAEACSCDIPCPCLESKVPTMGHCNETMIFHVDKGHYGPTSLDGLDVVIIGQSPQGKTFDQAIADKDLPIVNTYLPAGASDAVAAAADDIFTRMSFSMAHAGKKHAVKKLGIKAKWAPDALDIEIPGVLTARLKAQKDAKGVLKPFDALAATGVYGKGVQGVSVGLDFHDDGVSWTIKDRHAAWTPFAYASAKGPLPWEKAPAPGK
jgi:hypothetical protein